MVFIKKLMLRPVRYGCDFVTHARDLVHLSLGRHRLVFSEKPGLLNQTGSCTRVAVVATYPNETVLPFVRNLMRGLHENGFFVLAVAAKRLPEFVSSFLLQHCNVLLERFPIGRDFGSYKLGIEWIDRWPEFAACDTLALVNDSMFYPKHITQTIADMLKADADWLGLFENHLTRFHVQSFFQIFRRPVFQSQAFKQYWKSYIPLTSRTHSIRRGETGLTHTLTKAGSQPFAIYNSLAIRQGLAHQLRQPNNELLSRIVYLVLANAKSDVIPSRVMVDSRGNTVAVAEDEVLKSEFLASAVGKLAEWSNPTHSAGLICNMLFHAPIKRDICIRGTHASCDLQALARGFSEQEKECIERDIKRRGLPASIPWYTARAIKLAAGVE